MLHFISSTAALVPSPGCHGRPADERAHAIGDVLGAPRIAVAKYDEHVAQVWVEVDLIGNAGEPANVPDNANPIPNPCFESIAVAAVGCRHVSCHGTLGHLPTQELTAQESLSKPREVICG